MNVAITMENNKRDRSEYMRKYRAKNLERIQAYNRNYYWEHHEKMLAYSKQYYRNMKASMTEEELEERREYYRVMSRIYREVKNGGKRKKNKKGSP